MKTTIVIKNDWDNKDNKYSTCDLSQQNLIRQNYQVYMR